MHSPITALRLLKDSECKFVGDTSFMVPVRGGKGPWQVPRHDCTSFIWCGLVVQSRPSITPVDTSKSIIFWPFDNISRACPGEYASTRTGETARLPLNWFVA